MDERIPKIIVITGAESTGKTVLAEQLANYYQVPFYPEYAREYISGLDRDYTFQDIETIAKKQVEQYNEAVGLPHQFVFFDTWLIITKVWFEVVYKTCPEWVVNKIRLAKIAGFILNDLDIPWIPDPVRENGGENRSKLQKIYRQNLDFFGFKYQVNNGIGKDRLNNAVRIIEDSFL